MPASSENRRSSRASRQRLSVTPAVTTVRRGSHRPGPVASVEPAQPLAPAPTVGVSLMSSARGVRLSRNR